MLVEILIPYEPTQTSSLFSVEKVHIWIHVLMPAAMDNGPFGALVHWLRYKSNGSDVTFKIQTNSTYWLKFSACVKFE